MVIKYNAEKCYAYGMGISIHGYCQTEEEAKKIVDNYKPHFSHHCYGEPVYYYAQYIEVEPGEISTNCYQYSNNKDEIIIYKNNQQLNTLKPKWMKMVEKSKLPNKATERFKKK